MKTIMKFKSTITTEDSYPSCISVEYCCEISDSNDIYKEAIDYVENLIKSRIVDHVCECVGVIEVREARFWELDNIARYKISMLHE